MNKKGNLKPPQILINVRKRESEKPYNSYICSKCAEMMK